MAGKALVQRHLHWAVDYAETRGAGDHAEDVAQDVLEILVTRPIELKRASAVPCLKVCIRNRISLLRTDRGREWDPLPSQIDPATSPSSIAARHQVLALVDEQLGELKTAKRQLLLLRYRDDLEPGEIAEVTGQHPGTVRKDLSRLRSWLSKKIRR